MTTASAISEASSIFEGIQLFIPSLVAASRPLRTSGVSNDSEADAVDANLALRFPTRQRVREVDDSALGRAVNRVLAMRIQTRHRGRVDDHAAAILLHQRSGESGSKDHGLKIDFDHEMPSLGRRVGKARSAHANACVVVQDIEAAEF